MGFLSRGRLNCRLSIRSGENKVQLKMKKEHVRRSLRTWLTLILLGILGWQLVYPLIRRPIAKKQAALADEQSAIETQQRQIELFVRYMNDIRALGRRSLQSDASIAAIRYQEWLRKTCDDSQILDSQINLRSPIQEEQVGAKIPANMRLVASLENLGDLVDRIAASEILQRISRLKFKALPTVGVMECELDVDALAISDNAHFDPEVFSKQRRNLGLGAWMRNSQHFTRYVSIPVDIAPPPREIAVATEPPRETKVSRSFVDPLKWIRLVAIVNKDGLPRAWFYDVQNKVDIAVDPSQPLEVDGFIAGVMRIDDTQVYLEHQGKEVIVRLGSTIRQGIEAASAFSIP